MKTLKAKDIMNKHVITVQASWSVEHLAEFLVEHGISGAPVMAGEDKVVGVVSLTDIARYSALPVQENQEEAHEYYLRGLENQYSQVDLASLHIQEHSMVKVIDIMNPAIFSVEENTDVADIAEIMVRGRIHRVMVTKKEKVVGIITALDILKGIFEVSV